MTGLRPIHPTLRDKPILHLDATLRPELAARVLPGLEVHEVEAAAPHMALRLVTGSFGKGALCPEPRPRPGRGAAAGEPARARSSTTSRWQARRVAPGRVLVVTYKACEAAFAGIPGVETGHFNAIAGLDVYRDVRLLVVVGRPLPSDARWRRSSARCSAICPRAATPRAFAACACATAAAARCGSGRMPTTRPSCCARRSATTR